MKRPAPLRPLRWAGRLLGLVLAVVVIFGWGGMYLLQDRLLFLPPPYQSLSEAELTTRGWQPLLVETDGVKLRGWLKLPVGATGRVPLLLYFGGNGEDARSGLEHDLPGWAIAAFHYRGYGDSEGQPGEVVLKQDAVRIYDLLAHRAEIDPRRIVAIGRSLGSGVAVALAATRPVAGLVLVTPYDSLSAVASGHYPWVPVHWLLRHRFDSLALAPKLKTPALFVLAGRDFIVPNPHSLRLYQAWGGPKRQILLTEADHNSVVSEPGYRLASMAFLNELSRTQAIK
ncbi:alpha/beta hydrolase [Chitinimonas lacunae]|uniref:Alpha/beta hydrolase n=1 Tax=Chitinimonas lacunae TaxID=1963018 RepID=A0ABV8MU09_9NEIS